MAHATDLSQASLKILLGCQTSKSKVFVCNLQKIRENTMVLVKEEVSLAAVCKCPAFIGHGLQGTPYLSAHYMFSLV